MIVPFFQSSKRLAMVVMSALINWVEICWRATGDTGTVAKLGQCQSLQPWLSLFLCENTFFHTLTPFLSSSAHPAFRSGPLSCIHFLPCFPALLNSIVLLIMTLLFKWYTLISRSIKNTGRWSEWHWSSYYNLMAFMWMKISWLIYTAALPKIQVSEVNAIYLCK